MGIPIREIALKMAGPELETPPRPGVYSVSYSRVVCYTICFFGTLKEFSSREEDVARLQSRLARIVIQDSIVHQNDELKINCGCKPERL